MRFFWNTVIQSLKLPQKKAVFALNRIGMDFTVFYLFLLLGLASLPALSDQIITNQTSTFHMHTFFLLIYFFIFYYLIFVLIVFSVISIIAFIVTLFARYVQRKLRFSLLWKMTAFTTTIPLILFSFVSFFYPLNSFFLAIVIIYIFFILIKIILIYPKRRSRKYSQK